MANFGLSYPWFAKLNTETGKYSNAFKCGKAVSTSVTPAYNEASLYGDDQEIENVKEFKNASVSVGTDRLPIQASKILFGHSVTEDGEENNNIEDSANYAGYGFVTSEKLDGNTKFRACILLKVLFSEGEESFETKGDSIAFKTPTISGTATAVENGDWRKKSPYFDTKSEADQWIQEQLGATDTDTDTDTEPEPEPEPVTSEICAQPTASVPGGTYEEAQTVTLSTTTADAAINYTTDGTIPSESNGTEYTEPISIEETTELKAVAYKTGAETSSVMTEEYFIAE